MAAKRGPRATDGRELPKFVDVWALSRFRVAPSSGLELARQGAVTVVPGDKLSDVPYALARRLEHAGKATLDADEAPAKSSKRKPTSSDAVPATQD